MLKRLTEEDFIHLHDHFDEGSNIRMLDTTNKVAKCIEYVANELGQNGMAITDHDSISAHITGLQTVERLKKKGKYIFKTRTEADDFFKINKTDLIHDVVISIINEPEHIKYKWIGESNPMVYDNTNWVRQPSLKEDFKLILGNEIYLVDEEQMNKDMEEGNKVNFYHYILLAKDKIGHKQIRQLSSRAWKRSFVYKNMRRVPTFYSDIEEIIGEDKGHIIVSTACLGGRLPQLVLSLIELENMPEDELVEEDLDLIEELKDNIHEFICWNLDMFGEDFYIELQPTEKTRKQEIEVDGEIQAVEVDLGSEEQRLFNKRVLEIAKAYELPWIVTTDAHYMRAEDRPVHKAFLTSEESGNQFREVDAFYSTTRFFRVEELYDYLDYLDEEDITIAILNTKVIANKVENYSLHASPKIPTIPLSNEQEWYEVDEELIEQYPHIKELYYSDEPQHRFLIHQLFKGISENKIPSVALYGTLKRVDIECKELIGISKALNQPVGAYLVTMQKLVDIIWQRSVIGAGRGSAVGWVTNYLLGITQVNPLTQGFDMPHWRFLSAERPDMPKQYWALAVNPAKGCVA